MSEKDRIRWNEKYQEKKYPDAPSEIVKKFYPLAPEGLALDIAAGNGRNAIFLAKQGFLCDAVDVSDRAIGEISGKQAGVNALCADLDTWEIPAERYSLILNIRYLNRRLFPWIKEGLIPEGLLIFETWMEGGSEDVFSVSCRDFLLRSNELLHAFVSLQILYYEEKNVESCRGQGRIASLVGRKIP